jgi:transcriptional regulator with XRE-family HTH domain
MNFGTKLKILREAKNLSQQDMAEVLELSQSNCSRIESAEIKPSLEVIKATANYFRLPEAILVDDNERITINEVKDHGTGVNYGTVIKNPMEEMKALYERLLAEKDAYIALLQNKP